MAVPTKANVKLYDGNTVHVQVIGIILCCFPNCPIIYPVGLVYYFPVHPSNNISSGTLKCDVKFQNFTSKPIEHCDFVDPQGRSWISPYHRRDNLDHLQIKNIKVNPRKKNDIVVPTVYELSKYNL